MPPVKLFQFRHSPFCEKARLLLSAKAVPYAVQEVTPGVGQVDLFRRSGQRQVPVLQDGDVLAVGSVAIARHLDSKVPEPPLLPVDPQARARALLWENWADTTLAHGARMALLQAVSQDNHLRKALLPQATPTPLRDLLGALPGEMVSGVSQLLTRAGFQQLGHALEQLTTLVANGQPLLDAQHCVADVAVAAQLYGLKFPTAAGAELAGRGVPGIADHPLFEPLFAWRDRIYGAMGRGDLTPAPSSDPDNPASTPGDHG
ncbi:MAG: glutathione S-transferase [Candidatus Synechococcus spongiarum 15L]|uniref:Glutathione S-transferase n=1 Tax=Candidatus Synechococcus spongiarum 15L TaxID=1608419 RepID=A0A0G8AZA1_9SYNE|nr:glutathione S-transferase family protein [Candidatus Synechococcus spongiarum]KKZ14625.1 MAG: glutathione S-transferase [Candidatus Synechococcus spongiarum 15L]MCY4359334.1 glutathione S-transferase family protein [Cyanobacteria bacterium MAG APA_bin_95]